VNYHGFHRWNYLHYPFHRDRNCGAAYGFLRVRRGVRAVVLGPSTTVESTKMDDQDPLSQSIDQTNTRLGLGAVALALARADGETRSAEEIYKELIDKRLED
jgi:hypothetical protein